MTARSRARVTWAASSEHESLPGNARSSGQGITPRMNPRDKSEHRSGQRGVDALRGAANRAAGDHDRHAGLEHLCACVAGCVRRHRAQSLDAFVSRARTCSTANGSNGAFFAALSEAARRCATRGSWAVACCRRGSSSSVDVRGHCPPTRRRPTMKVRFRGAADSRLPRSSMSAPGDG